MSRAQRILVLSGVLLLAITMAFGVGYAIFDEHQTLVGMGEQMAGGFMAAADGDMAAAFVAFDNFGAMGAEYSLEIHSHGHWGMLALILIILGLVIERTGLSEARAVALAWLLALSAILFPLGVILQIGPAATLGKALAVPASAGMVLGLLIAAWCLAKNRT